MIYELSLDFVPVAQKRPRFTKSGHTYSPSRATQAQLGYLMKVQWAKQPLECPLAVSVILEFPRPKSVTDKKRPLHCVKPDISNCLKLVEDAGNKVIWKDDCQIVQIIGQKVYGTEGRIRIQIRELEPTSPAQGLTVSPPSNY